MRKIEELLNNGYQFELHESVKQDKQFQRVVSKVLTKNTSPLNKTLRSDQQSTMHSLMLPSIHSTHYAQPH